MNIVKVYFDSNEVTDMALEDEDAQDPKTVFRKASLLPEILLLRDKKEGHIKLDCVVTKGGYAQKIFLYVPEIYDPYVSEPCKPLGMGGSSRPRAEVD